MYLQWRQGTWRLISLPAALTVIFVLQTKGGGHNARHEKFVLEFILPFPRSSRNQADCTFLPSCYITVFGSLPVLTGLIMFSIFILPWQPFFGGSASINQISGKIKSGEEVLASLNGHWVMCDNHSCWQSECGWLWGAWEDGQPLAGPHGGRGLRGPCPASSCCPQGVQASRAFQATTLKVIHTPVVPSTHSARSTCTPRAWAKAGTGELCFCQSRYLYLGSQVYDKHWWKET